MDTNNNIQKAKNVPPFVRYCSAIIPTMFDDSLSYYEALCALNNFLQTNVIDTINNNATVTEEYINLTNELKEYVENYFENLDVQEEINNKLDEMVEDGTMDEIVARYIDGHVYRYIVDNTMSDADITALFALEKSTIIEFQTDVTFTETKTLTGNTTLLLNNHTLTFDVPTVSEDWTKSHGFFNFVPDGEYYGYNGNGNIHIKDGKIIGGNCSFCHGKDISFENVHFYNCRNDHIIELAGCKNVHIDGCTLEGSAMVTNKEFVQFDVMTYSFFPHMEQGNPSYDGTLNDYIYIEGCTFKDSGTTGYKFGKAIGQHSYDAETVFHHIYIRNNTFDNPVFNSIELYNFCDVEITGNYFTKTGYTTGVEGSHIRVREKHDNYLISNNIFEGNCDAIEMASNQQQCYNWMITKNVFKGYKYTTNTKAIIQIVACDNANIDNNYFEDYTQRMIQVGTGQGTVSTINVYIRNNAFVPKNNTSVVGIIGYGGNVHLYNNEFRYEGYTHTQLIFNDSNSDNYGQTKCSGNFFSQNLWSANRTFYSSKNDYSEMYDIKRNGFVPQSDTFTLDRQSLSDNIKFTDFNTLIVQVNDNQSDGNGQYNFEIKANSYSGKLTSYRYRIPAIKADGTVGSVWIILNVDGTSISFGSSDNSIKLTYVGLINKR